MRFIRVILILFCIYVLPQVIALRKLNDKYIPDVIELLDQINNRITNDLENKEQNFNEWHSTLSAEVESLASEYEEVKSEYFNKKEKYFSKKNLYDHELPIRQDQLDYHRFSVQKQKELISRIKNHLDQFPRSARMGEPCDSKKTCENGTVCMDQTCVAADCRAHLEASYESENGIYFMKMHPDRDPIPIYCDMKVDNGGWTLVLNYLHRRHTNPGLDTFYDHFPIPNHSELGIDGSRTSSSDKSWGHISPSLMSELPNLNEVRFFCKTSSHQRKLHFSTSSNELISYFSSGSGSGCSVDTHVKILDGHSGNLPHSQDDCFSNEGELAMTDFPFYTGGTYHWGVRGKGDRWECDDYPGDDTYSTYHQIWIR
eukprot:gb/GECH01011973.1/.p1 GENE.gb/GECH01011973.1/~~gb/GECH01011973.1/.p1  ORF type:complete len:371 (+),score=87.17 gb/GECH01011973.1/:1-1113(+)